MKNNTFNSLDVIVNASRDGIFIINVYTKTSETGLYANFKSHTPENNKASVVKTLVARAIRYSSTWNTCHVELDRLRQVFVNNGYSQALGEKIVNNKLNHYLSNESKKNEKVIHILVQLFSITNFKNDSCRLNQIVESHVRATEKEIQIRVTPCYKSVITSSPMSTRPQP